MTFQQGLPDCIQGVIEEYLPGGLFWVQFLDEEKVDEGFLTKAMNDFLSSHDPGEEEQKLCESAAEEDNWEIVRLLIGKGTVDPRANDFRILGEAIRHKRFRVAEWIQEHWVGPDDDIWSRLMTRTIEIKEVETFKWMFRIQSFKFDDTLEAMLLILMVGALGILKFVFLHCEETKSAFWSDHAFDMTIAGNHIECVLWLKEKFGGYQLWGAVDSNKKLARYLRRNAEQQKIKN